MTSQIHEGRGESGVGADVTEVELVAMQELRFETQGAFKLQVLKGKVEYFGTAYSDPTRLYELQGRGALFTWTGAVVRLHGKLDVCCKEENSTMVLFANLHVALNKLRESAKVSGGRGPVVMLAGPTDVGKSSLCRILLNYAVQTNWTPIFVDVDVGQNDIGIPATIGATKVTHTLAPDTLHHPHHTSVYPFGHTTPSNNLSHYHHLISKLAELVDVMMKSDRLCGCSGVVINTCGWVTNAGYQALLHTAKSFKVDRVVVLGDPELSSLLSPILPSTLISSSSAVVKRGRDERFNKRQQRLQKYLFESYKHPATTPIHHHTNTTIPAFHNPTSTTTPFLSNPSTLAPSTYHPPHPLSNITSQPPTNLPASKQTTTTTVFNPLAPAFEPAVKRPPAHPSTFFNPTPFLPPVFDVDFKSVKVYLLNDKYVPSHRQKNKLLRVQLNPQHSRMVLALSSSPDHLLNKPFLGVALILEVLEDRMLLMTSCQLRPTCMLLMPSLHYPQPIPPLSF